MSITQTIARILSGIIITLFMICHPVIVMDLLGGNDNAIVAGLGGAFAFAFFLGLCFSDQLAKEDLLFFPAYRRFIETNRFIAPVWKYLFADVHAVRR